MTFSFFFGGRIYLLYAPPCINTICLNYNSKKGLGARLVFCRPDLTNTVHLAHLKMQKMQHRLSEVLREKKDPITGKNGNFFQFHIQTGFMKHQISSCIWILLRIYHCKMSTLKGTIIFLDRCVF